MLFLCSLRGPKRLHQYFVENPNFGKEGKFLKNAHSPLFDCSVCSEQTSFIMPPDMAYLRLKSSVFHKISIFVAFQVSLRPKI